MITCSTVRPSKRSECWPHGSSVCEMSRKEHIALLHQRRGAQGCAHHQPFCCPLTILATSSSQSNFKPYPVLFCSLALLLDNEFQREEGVVLSGGYAAIAAHTARVDRVFVIIRVVCGCGQDLIVELPLLCVGQTDKT
jgi:hypothetical protein